jgi:hypothetical protein
MKTILSAERFGHSHPIDTKDRNFSTFNGSASVGFLIVDQISTRLIFRNSEPSAPISLPWNRAGNLLSWNEPPSGLFEISI